MHIKLKYSVPKKLLKIFPYFCAQRMQEAWEIAKAGSDQDENLA